MQRKKLELLKLNREVLRNWNPDLLVGSIAQPELNVLSSEKGHSGLGPRSLRMGHELAIAGIPKEEQIRLILQMLEKPPNWIQLPPQGENAYVTVKKFAGVIFIRNTIRREILKTHTARKKTMCSSFSFAVSIWVSLSMDATGKATLWFSES